MLLRAFRKLLAIHGTVPERWPAARRAPALRLLAASSEAMAMLTAARRLEALLDTVEDGGLDAAVLRLTARFDALPAQRHALRWWPVLLSRWDFNPAWPRVAALVAVAALGAMVGIIDPNVDTAPTSDLSALLFDSASGVGIGP